MCHTVVVDRDPKSGELQYQASSPDELALIQGARQGGFKLTEKTASTMTIYNKHAQRDELYDIIAEFPFDSTRKRMSLIVKFESDYYLMCKGADSIILPRIKFEGQEGAESKIKI